jgi:hypothetical protein
MGPLGRETQKRQSWPQQPPPKIMWTCSPLMIDVTTITLRHCILTGRFLYNHRCIKWRKVNWKMCSMRLAAWTLSRQRKKDSCKAEIWYGNLQLSKGLLTILHMEITRNWKIMEATTALTELLWSLQTPIQIHQNLIIISSYTRSVSMAILCLTCLGLGLI